jgi:FeS assembly SUF system protein
MTNSTQKPEYPPQPVGAAALVAQAGGQVHAVAPEQKPAQTQESIAAASVVGKPLTLVEARNLKERVIEIMKTIFDPEIPVNIYELGMVYNVSVDLSANVDVTMTLTSPACPVAGSLPGEVQNKIKSAPGVNNAKVNLVWNPPWSKDMMSEAAKLQLNLV